MIHPSGSWYIVQTTLYYMFNTVISNTATYQPPGVLCAPHIKYFFGDIFGTFEHGLGLA